MAARLIALSLQNLAKRSANSRIPSMVCSAAYSSGNSGGYPNPELIIGKREVVGYGFNGQANYMDRPDFPMPAIRFREPTSDIQALREKEKGDWKKLSKEEKKALYRASFCQTFAEINAPTGEWKSVIGLSILLASFAIWFYMTLKLFVYEPLPESFSEESQRKQLRQMLDLKVNPISGLSSQWDYEKDDWKK